MELQKHLICMKQMTFGCSTGQTCELILADEWFGYAESECFSTTRSLTQRMLNALNHSMFFSCRCFACQVSTFTNHDICNQAGGRTIQSPLGFYQYNWDWRSAGNDGNGKTRVHRKSTECQHRYYENAHGPRVLVSTARSRQWYSAAVILIIWTTIW